MTRLSTLVGLTFNLTDLYQQLSDNGWGIKKIKYDKPRGMFVAEAQASHGEELEAWGPSEGQAVSNLLLNALHRNGLRMGRVASWTYTFTDQLDAIAEAYSKAPIYEPKAAVAFMELARDAEARAKAIRDQIDILITNNPEPYPNADKMCEDIRKRRKLEVSQAGIDHPLWSTQQVISFRIAFDVLGYCAASADWGWEGTNQAFAAYAHHIPALAQQALFGEVIGQTAYSVYYRAYGPLKIALFPDFMDGAQQKENPHDGYRGVHPTNMLLPTEIPEAKSIESKLAQRKPVQVNSDGSPMVDINAGYVSPYADKPLFNYSLEHPQDMLGTQELQGMAQQLHTGWGDEMRGAGSGANGEFQSDEEVKEEWAKYKEMDPQGAETMRKAVGNAITAACLSPQTQLHDNAIQYQDTINSGIPYDTDDPNHRWDVLEKARQRWNLDRFTPPNATPGDIERVKNEHNPWFYQPVGEQSQFKQLASVMYSQNPEMGQEDAELLARRMIKNVKNSFMRRLVKQNEELESTTDTDKLMRVVDNEANSLVMKTLKLMNKGSTAHDTWAPAARKVWQEFERAAATREMDPMFDKQLDRFNFDDSYNGYHNENVFNRYRYGAFMSQNGASQLMRHLDDIVEAALVDVHAHDGTGHHFRARVLSYNVQGIAAKLASFMWLLLQPLTSQLGTIDVHMCRLLGYTSQKTSPSPRDYFRLERELQARRDAMGLNHIPLGQFQWMVWDLQRTGQREPADQMSLFGEPKMTLHQDHSALRVLNPTPASQVRWLPPPPDSKNRTYTFPFMTATDEAAKAAGEDYANTVEKEFHSQMDTPTRLAWPSDLPNVMSKVGMSGRTPWFVHPQTGQRMVGQPGQTLMAHLIASGLTIDQAWQLEDETAGKDSPQEPQNLL